MKPERIMTTGTNAKKWGMRLFFQKLRNRITDLFEPEEVEVTFEVKGKNVNYTYTKVAHKQVA